MNLYVRLILMFLRIKFEKPVSIFDEFVTRHRVMPNDLDLLGHMNNGRYFTITDLARIEMLIRAGVWKELRKRDLMPLMAGETVQFRRPLMPFQKYSIVTKTLGWDDKFVYVEHKFISKKGLHALIIVKVRVIGSDQERLAPKQFLGFGNSGEIADINLNDPINKWTESTQMHWKQNAA